MTVFFIISAIIVIFTVLLLMKASVVIKCHDNVELYLKVLFFKFKILPNDKSVDYRDYSLKKLKKKKKKELRKLKKSKKQQTSDVKKEKNPTKKSDIRENIALITKLAKILISKFFKHLKIDVKKIVVTVATDDPAKTGILYGIVCTGITQLIEVLNAVTNLNSKENSEIDVKANFLPGKTCCDIDLRFSIRMFGIIDIGISLAYNYIKDKLNKQSKESKNVNGGNKNG